MEKSSYDLFLSFGRALLQSEHRLIGSIAECPLSGSFVTVIVGFGVSIL
jgi:hypothetical protein